MDALMIPSSPNALPLLGILVLLGILIYHIYQAYRAEISYVQSSIDRTRYLVKNTDDKEAAADQLALLKQKLKTLVSYLETEYPEKDGIQRLTKNFEKTIFAERTRTHVYTSYTVDKGVKMVYCLRQANGQLVDFNTLMYVGVHELGHIMTQDMNHSQEFWDNFKFLLDQAVKLNLWKYHDYDKQPMEYCGETLGTPPLHAQG